MPSYRVTTERLVEADSAEQAAGLSMLTPPDEWVVYSDDYKVVEVVTPIQWHPEEIVDAEIITSDGDVVIRDQQGNVVASYPAGNWQTNDIFEVDIDPGEDFTFPERGEEPFFFKRSGVDLTPHAPAILRDVENLNAVEDRDA